MIPVIFGQFLIAGNIIWATDLVPITQNSGGSGGNLQATSKTHYVVDLAIGVCRGPITSIDRIWAEDLLIYDGSQSPAALANDTIRIYLGDEAQTVDSLIAAVLGANGSPAYRGLAYVVFDNLDLQRWGNRIPSITYEVTNVVPYHTIIENTGGLQVYYRFDTTPGWFTDSGPKGYNLSYSGGAPTSTGGHANQALVLPVSTKVFHVSGNDLDLQPAQFSAELWYAYQGGLSPNGTTAQFEYHNPTTAELAWRLWIEPNIFTGQVFIDLRIFTNTSGVVDVFTYNTGLTDNFWHHVVATYDSAGMAILYVDGLPVQQTIAPVAPITITPDAANEVEIDEGNTTSASQVYLDECAFYNTLLSASTVEAHYQGKGSTVGTILADVFDQAGLTPAQYDVSQAGDYVQGFIQHTRQDARAVLQYLLMAYDTDLVEVDGKIVAKKRGSAPVLTVPVGDLAAHVSAGAETDPPPKVQTKRLQDFELPFRIDLTYYDKATNYQLGLQGATRFTKDTVQEPVTLHTTMVFGANSARQLAQKELYKQWTERQQYQFSLPPKYLQLAAGDVLNIPVAGQTKRCRIVDLDAALVGPLAITAVEDDASLLTQTALGAAAVPASDLIPATATILAAWNSNALRDADAAGVGYYSAMNGPAGQNWLGGALYASRDGGASYQEVATQTAGAVLGTANTLLAPGSGLNDGGADLWDTTHTVDILITSGSAPVSTSDAAVLAGGNACYLGTEILQFGTVIPQGGNVYRLSRLLRGRRGTEPHQNEHVIGEAFALLDTVSVTHVPLTPDMRGGTVLLKAITLGEPLSAAAAVAVYIEGQELKTYSPVQQATSRDGSHNITFTWVRRTRIAGELVDGGDVPLSELVESYVLSVMQGLPASISSITNDPSSGVVTAAAHGFANGQQVALSGIKGMTPVNGQVFTVGNVTANTFTIGMATQYFGVYAAGTGTAERVMRQITVSSPTASYTAAAQTTDFGAAQNPVRWWVQQIGLYGPGYASTLVSQ